MNQLLKTLLITGIFLLSGGVNGALAGEFGTIIIDPGHGGKDRGGSYGRVYEKHLALDTSFRVNYMLRKKGYDTRFTRTSDRFVSLSKRAQFANQYSNSILISIHYNWTYKKYINGIETFYHSKRSRPLAQYIQSAILKRQKARNRGVKYARYYILRHAKNPAALVECGFLSNYSERMRCMKGWYRQRMAEGIVAGIEKYQKARKRGWVK